MNKVRPPAVPGVGDRSDHLHGRTPNGTPARPGLHTLLPWARRLYRVQSTAGTRAEPFRRRSRIYPQRTPRWIFNTAPGTFGWGRAGERLGSGSSAPSSASSFRQSLLLGRRRGLWALPAVLRDSQWVFSGPRNTPARKELPAGL